MFITSQEYDVLQAPIEQRFEGCQDHSEATLFVRQRDVHVLFLKLSKKLPQVRCNRTGKMIKKTQWNTQTKADSIDLLAQHKVSKIGWYIVMFLLIGLPIAIAIGVYSEVQNSKKLSESYSFKSDAEKRQLIATLEEGDFFQTSTYVYKIKSVNSENIVVYKGAPSENILDPINPNQEFDTTNEIVLNRAAFLKRLSVSTEGEFGGDMIMGILDN